MKIYLIYLLLFLSFFAISCQEQYSDAILVEYFELDKSLKYNNQFIEETTSRHIQELAERAKRITPLQLLVDKAYEIKDASTDLNLFINTLRDSLILKTGGCYEEEEVLIMNNPFLKHFPKGGRNIALVEQILFSTDSDNLDSVPSLSKLSLLEQKIQALYNQHLQIIESCWDDGGLKASIFADINYKEKSIQSIKVQLSQSTYKKYKPKEHQYQTWADFNFKDKPLAAILPILSQIQNDIRVAEYTLVSFLGLSFLVVIYITKPLMFLPKVLNQVFVWEKPMRPKLLSEPMLQRLILSFW